jgi:hypothetical protein
MSPRMVAEPATRRIANGKHPRPALLVIGAGFEERSRALLNLLRVESIGALLAIVYRPSLAENCEAEALVEQLTTARDGVGKSAIVECDPSESRKFQQGMQRGLEGCSPLAEGEVWVDISGLPMHVICMVLALCRERWVERNLRIIYTEAREYFPTKEEYERAKKRSSFQNGSELPRALTSEMDHNVIPEMFSGFAVREAPTCLILQAGYERHRSEGVVDQINPNKLVIVYPRPARQSLQWRVLMARGLHASLAGTRQVSEEEVQTLGVGDSLDLITTYYEMLFDNHNIVIAPIGSKMQTVAAFLAWERFRDIQIVYPVPVSYLPRRFSRGVGTTFWLRLPSLRADRGVLGVGSGAFSTE